ncbi:hypothetical protein AAFF_G00187390 [Aldrovandia affinis]|uniref:Uncharacterized protein n=1 Tax=Aldrovandia affinis TaxID=143900 RepID=A0AAD7SZ48_9TELE|nr:hypothetical protein AAFF_G00187390 [Aldrovandia affinis]
MDSVLHLGQQEMSFRGQGESSRKTKTGNRSNFLDKPTRISDQDSDLCKRLSMAMGFCGTSDEIQNDPIQVVVQVLQDTIRAEVKEA